MGDEVVEQRASVCVARGKESARARLIELVHSIESTYLSSRLQRDRSPFFDFSFTPRLFIFFFNSTKLHDFLESARKLGEVNFFTPFRLSLRLTKIEFLRARARTDFSAHPSLVNSYCFFRVESAEATSPFAMHTAKSLENRECYFNR